MFSLLIAALSLAPIDAALHAPTLRGAHVGVLAVDTATSAVLYAHNADDDFVPASTFKLIAGSAALDRLGPQYTYDTEVDASGEIDNGKLRGNLYLRGGGDAELQAADLDAAAAAVSAAGVRHVDGSLLGDASRYDAPRYPPGWAIDDLPYGYAAVPGALLLGDGVAHVQVLPGAWVGAPTHLEVATRSDAFSFENDAVTGAAGSPDTTDLRRSWDLPTLIRVVGSYPLGARASDDLEPAVPDPAAYALDVFRQALLRHGVSVGAVGTGTVPANAHPLWTHASEPFARLLADCWQPSDNLLALGARSPIAGTFDTRARGIAAEQQWLGSIGVDPHTLTIADGSGLSAYDRATPRSLVAILQHDWNGPQRTTIEDALPLAGVRGTLEHTFVGTPLAGAVYAKTGSVNHSRLLAGFLQRRDGGTVTFAIMVNDWMDESPGAAEALDAVRAAILTVLRGD